MEVVAVSYDPGATNPPSDCETEVYIRDGIAHKDSADTVTHIDWVLSDHDGFVGPSDPRFLKIFHAAFKQLRKDQNCKWGQFVEHKAPVVSSLLPDPICGGDAEKLFAFGEYQQVDATLLCAIILAAHQLELHSRVESRGTAHWATYVLKRLLLYSSNIWNDRQDKKAAREFLLKLKEKGATEEKIIESTTCQSLSLQLHLYMLRFLANHLVAWEKRDFKKEQEQESRKRKIELDGETKDPSSFDAGVHEPPRYQYNSRKGHHMFYEWPECEANIWKAWIALLKPADAQAWMLSQGMIVEHSVADQQQSNRQFLCDPKHYPKPLAFADLYRGRTVVTEDMLADVCKLYMTEAVRIDMDNMAHCLMPFPQLMWRAMLGGRRDCLTVQSTVEMICLRMAKSLMMEPTLWGTPSTSKFESDAEVKTIQELEAEGLLPPCQQLMHRRFRENPDGPLRLDHNSRVYMFNFMLAVKVPLDNAVSYARLYYQRGEDVSKTVKSVYQANRHGMICQKMAEAKLCPFVSGCSSKSIAPPDIEEVGDINVARLKCTACLNKKMENNSAELAYTVNSPAAFTQHAMKMTREKETRFINVEVEPTGDAEFDQLFLRE